MAPGRHGRQFPSCLSTGSQLDPGGCDIETVDVEMPINQSTHSCYIDFGKYFMSAGPVREVLRCLYVRKKLVALYLRDESTCSSPNIILEAKIGRELADWRAWSAPVGQAGPWRVNRSSLGTRWGWLG